MIAPSREGRRTQRRFALSLKGRVFGPCGMAKDCTLLDLSPGGAALECAPFPDGSDVLLQLERIGRVNAVCSGYAKGVLRLKFECPEATRQHIAMVLGQLLESGQAHSLRSRREDRLATANFHFTCANGDKIPCDALDISLRGISVRSSVKPPVGEMVMVGRSAGRVVRHHDEGVVIQFEAMAAPAFPRLPRSYQPARPRPAHMDNLV